MRKSLVVKGNIGHLLSFKKCDEVRELKVPKQFRHNQSPHRPQNVAILSSINNKSTAEDNKNEFQ
jgi:hypothetical protein